ncbi:MAG: MFS transporter, partial [Proteobacteria bacterium]
MTIMSNATISPSLPGLEAMFSDQPDAELLTRLLVTAPSIVVAVSAPFLGLVVDRVGRRAILLIGALLYAVLGTAGLYLPDLQSILFSRLGLGVAVAAIMTAQSALIGDYFVGEMRGRFLGYQTSASHFGGLAFVSLAGVLAAQNVRAPFAIYGFAALMLPLFWFALPPAPHPKAAGPMVTTSTGGVLGWMAIVLSMVVAGAATMTIYYAIPTQVPYHLARIDLGGPTTVGWILGTLMLAGGVSGFLSGRFRARFGQIITPSFGLLLIAAGFAGIGLTESLFGQSLSAGLAGGGIGFTMPTFMTAALHAAPGRRRGFVAGLITSSIFVGQFASPILSQPLVASLGSSGMFLTFAALAVGTYSLEIEGGDCVSTVSTSNFNVTLPNCSGGPT